MDNLFFALWKRPGRKAERPEDFWLHPPASGFGRLLAAVAIIAVAACLTALQLVPVPQAVVEHLDPTGATLRAEGSAVVGSAPWSTLTMDAGGSLRALVGFVVLLGIAVVALRRAVSERGRFQLIAVVGLICAATAVVVGVHAVLDEKLLYGLYQPHHGVHLLGPLLNLNHLGCLMAIGSVVGIGLAAYPRQAAWARAGWLVVTAACGGIALYTVSRGATLALIAGSLVTVAILVTQRFTSDSPRHRRSFVTSSLPIAVVAACAVVLVVYSSAGLVEQKFSSTTLDEWNAPMSKFAAWKSATTLIGDSPWVGVGRGGFESSFTRVHPASGRTTFSHLENEYLQAVVDWGIPGAIVLGAACVWLAMIVLRRWREGPLAAAAIGGLVVVVVQSNVDFGVELLGIAAPVTVLAASLAYVPIRETTSSDAVRTRSLRVGHVLALLAGAALLLVNITTTLDEDHERLASGDVTVLDEALSRHPLDYYGYAVAAELAFRRGDPEGVRLLNHALRLNPTHGGLHRLAAQRLRRAEHLEQAAIEYEAALRFSPTLAPLLQEIVRELPPPLAVRAIPTDLAADALVTTTLAEAGRADVATAWLERVLQRHPDQARACELLIAHVREHDDDAAVHTVKARCPVALADATTLDALAVSLAQRQRYDALIVLLADAPAASGPSEHHLRAWMALCDAYRARHRWDEATSCLRALDASSAVTAALHAQVTTRIELIRRETQPSVGPP